MKRKILGGFLLLIASGLVLFAAYWNSNLRQVPLVFSQQSMIEGLWHSYKLDYVEPSTGRVIDTEKDGSTTSEGQSYVLLRAAWMDDKQAFDQSWDWTRRIMGRPTDHLFSWLFGKRPDGTYGIVTAQGGQNTASDADADIALALLMANARWKDDAYLTSAKAIISDIWQQEVVTIGGVPYLAADNVEKSSTQSFIVVNPSYISPATYAIFATVDPAHDWNRLRDSSYRLLQNVLTLPLDKAKSAGLPPDWVGVDRVTGRVFSISATEKDLTTNYSFDAMRVPWRLALDWQWYRDPRDKALLDQMAFLGDAWKSRATLLASYSHDGQGLYDYESPAFYGSNIGYFMVSQPAMAQDVYREKLLWLYNPDDESWKQPLGYYDSNWAWFGLALYSKELPNLAGRN